MENTAVLNVRISEQLKQQLEELAKEKNETVSDYVRELLTKRVLQDDDCVPGISQVTVEIPKEVADTVALCAELRGQSVADFVREYTARYMDCDSLADWCSWLVELRIRELLKENGAMTKDELSACLPSDVFDLDYHLANLKVSYVDQRPDGKYELRNSNL